MVISSQDYCNDLLSGLHATIAVLIKLLLFSFSDNKMDVRSCFPCIENLHMPPDASSEILVWLMTSSAHVGMLSPFITHSCSHLTSYFCILTIFVENNIFQYVLFFPPGTFLSNLFSLIASYFTFKKITIILTT